MSNRYRPDCLCYPGRCLHRLTRQPKGDAPEETVAAPVHDAGQHHVGIQHPGDALIWSWLDNDGGMVGRGPVGTATRGWLSCGRVALSCGWVALGLVVGGWRVRIYGIALVVVCHCWRGRQAGPRLNIKTVFLGMRTSIVKITQSWDLYNGNPYTSKTTSLYWDGPQFIAHKGLRGRYNFKTCASRAR